MGSRAVGALAAIGLIWWVASSSNHRTPAVAASSLASDAQDADADADSADLADSDADTSDIKGSETYDEYDARRDNLDGAAGSYEGFGCTQDCSGHEAGYQWAEEHGITDESECGGDSWSFEEGCVAYAREQSDDEDEYDPGGDDGGEDD